MSKTLKVIVAIFLFLLILQSTSFYFYGKKTIVYKYFDKVDYNNYHKGVIGVFDNNAFSVEEKKEIEERLLKRYSSVYFTSDTGKYENTFRLGGNVDNWGLSYKIEYIFPFIAIVNEEQGTLYYGEFWETKLIWCFYRWIKIKRECTLQS